jgi:KEOPS complex subunit Cgi121
LKKELTITSDEFNEKVAMIGFSNVKIENINVFLEQFRKKNINVQFFDAKKLAGSEHLYFAALNALNAFERKMNISNNLAVESLIYASAQRQITKAVKMLGITENSSQVAVLIIAKNRDEKKSSLNLVNEILPGKRDDTVLNLSLEKIKLIKKLFNISETEFEAQLKKQGFEKEALTDLIIERMALLVLK